MALLAFAKRVQSRLMQNLEGRRLYGRRPLAFLLLAVGCVITLCVGYSYLSIHLAQRDLARQWERQNASGVDVVSTEKGITRVIIPKIQLDAMVSEGTSRNALMQGPGHLERTPFPGERGNSVIAAHRDTFFRNLNKLTVGDDILIRRSGSEAHFVVKDKKIVEPKDLSVIAPTTSSSLTLITCYPTYYIGPAPKRLVVIAEREETTPLTAAKWVHQR